MRKPRSAHRVLAPRSREAPRGDAVKLGLVRHPAGAKKQHGSGRRGEQEGRTEDPFVDVSGMTVS